MTTYRERLKERYSELPEGQQRVAKLIFEKPDLIALTRAVKIGEEVGVSESTVIRLSQSLGYKGYMELQDIIQKELRENRTLSQHQEITKVGSDRPFYKESFKEDIRNITRTMDSIDETDFKKAIQLISKAEKIYVIGGLSSYGIASFLAHWLNIFFHNTTLLQENNTQHYTHVSEIDANTLIIPVILPRYTRNTIELTKYAKTLKAKVLSITDSELSPVVDCSDIALYSPINTEIKADSYTAPLSLITSLVRSVAIENDQLVEGNLEKAEKVLQDLDVFYK